MYKILGSDQKEYGPVTAEVVREWIAARRANAHTKVQKEGGGEWTALATFPEFQEALRIASSTPPNLVEGATFTPASVPPEAQNKGLAITSLILGVLSLACFGLLLGLPAIILGHIAHSRSRRMPARYGGGGMAVAGFVMGYCSILSTFILAGLMLPALAKAKAKAQTINCVSNMKQIGLAARMYANDNQGMFPSSFLAMSNELTNPKVLTCPSDSARTRASTWADFSPPANVSYEFLLPGAKETDVESQPNQHVFQCPVHGHVVLGDGSVQQNPSRRRRR